MKSININVPEDWEISQPIDPAFLLWAMEFDRWLQTPEGRAYLEDEAEKADWSRMLARGEPIWDDPAWAFGLETPE